MISLLSNSSYYAEGSGSGSAVHRRVAAEAYYGQFARLGFDSARQNRMHSTFTRTIGSADSVLSIDREKLVQFSRQMYDNSVPYRAFTDRFVDLVLGTGLNPRGKNKSARRAVDLFLRWCDRPARCDSRGVMSFWEMQRMALREIIIAGDQPSLKTNSGALQVIESEQLRDPYGGTLNDGSPVDLDMVRDGVEIDAQRRIVRFWISEYAKQGGYYLDPDVRGISANLVLFPAYRSRASQTRGVPMWAPALERFAMYEDYLDAVGVSANLAARLALLIKTQHGNSAYDMTKAMGGQSSKSATTPVPGEANLMSIDAGSIFHLRPGEDVETVQGAQPTTAFESYSRAILSMLAAMAGAPVEVLMLDNSRVNYSTARMAEYQARNAAAPFREIIRGSLCDPVYAWWRARAILAGEIPNDPQSGEDHIVWNAPARWSIDPGREYKAEHDAVQFNFKTHEQVVREMDGDPEEVVRNRSEEVKRDRRLGIAPPLQPGQEQAGAGDTQPKKDPPAEGDGPATPEEEAVAENLSKGEKLNGAQITAAIEILRQLKAEELTAFQAVELLTAVGIAPEKAERIAKDTEDAKENA